MKDVTILALEGTMASTVTGPMDIFAQAGVLWNQICGEPARPYFRVNIATITGKPVECRNRVVISPHHCIDDVAGTDLIIISAEDLAALEKTIPMAKSWLLKQSERGATIASVCTGAFLLAETGLLDGKRATTHWGFADLFRTRYPKIDLRPECIITDEGALLCAGGAHSYFDLSLYLVERYCGFDIAAQCARALLLDFGRQSQIPFAVFEYQKHHKDEGILAAQLLLEQRHMQHIDLEAIAEEVGMSLRNFKRRFKKATGDAPLAYLQRFRIETAKRFLETGTLNVAEISYQVGYEDVGFFRALFKRYQRMSPAGYRQKYKTPGTRDAG